MEGDFVKFQIPITKIDEVKREVWGTITDETPDKQGEIMDYDSSVENFKIWSGEIAKNTNGKSLGNCRLMHQPTAIGKVIAINMDDAKKSIEAGVKVVDDAAWKLVQENVLSAFSIGGGYEKRWKDGDYTRYTIKSFSKIQIPNRRRYLDVIGYKSRWEKSGI